MENYVTKDDLKDKVAQLEAKNAELAAKLEKEQSRKGNMTGWRLHCKNPEYSGIVQGVQFVKGEAFVEDLKDDPTRIKLVETLCDDFGYTHEYVSDGKVEEVKVDKKAKSLIESVSLPKVATHG